MKGRPKFLLSFVGTTLDGHVSPSETSDSQSQDVDVLRLKMIILGDTHTLSYDSECTGMLRVVVELILTNSKTPLLGGFDTESRIRYSLITLCPHLGLPSYLPK